MDHIGANLEKIQRNIKLNTADPVAAQGFTQVPNFIHKNPNLSVGAKVVYAMFLSYAWHNDFCYPGQARVAADIGMTQPRVAQLTSELQEAGLVEIERRGQGKTNLYTINFTVKKKGNTKI
jgi:DNA-binding transcriptional ArsR family regulator